MFPPPQYPAIGWREWACLPALGVPALKAKLDTGARTSALHICWLHAFQQQDQTWVRFHLHPLRNDTRLYVGQAPAIDRRWVTDSGGHREQRWIITTTLQLGAQCWDIELSLTARDNLQFRLLLGRTALQGRFLIDPALSYHLGRPQPHYSHENRHSFP